MKQLLIGAALFFSLSAMAQEEKEIQNQKKEIEMIEEDTVRLKFEKVKILIITPKELKTDTFTFDTSVVHDKEKTHKYWSAFDIGVNAMMQKGGSFQLPADAPFLAQNYAKSISLALNFAEWKLPIYKEYIGFVTGLGLEWDAYALKDNYRLNPGQKTLSAVYDSSANFSKNKLKASYINVPLMIGFGSSQKANKGVHIAAGVVVGYLFNSKQKLHFNDQKQKVNDDFNLNPIKASAMIRVSVKNFKLWASYGLTPLFVKNQGPDLIPFNAGITLIGL